VPYAKRHYGQREHDDLQQHIRQTENSQQEGRMKENGAEKRKENKVDGTIRGMSADRVLKLT
jgi:hypothetical protein